ncbi:MAG: HDOD domain-containing protein [Betaproteobacteria bacterium]|nr:HDOD domain-containing protein [Betaproteobacteria bacterium]
MINRQFSLDAWVLYFEQAQLPVLRRTQEELPRLEEREDALNGQELAAVILRDPIMTVKVLRYLQEHRGKRQITDITTISRAVMMIGTTPFFKAFASQPIIEEHLDEYPQAREGAMRVMSRAYHASLYALDWAVQHHDMDTDEVVVAALLRDLAEMLLWCFAPEPMLAIREKMRLNPALRSAAAQQEILGFRIIELQLALIQAWQLPGLLQSLMDEAHADHPRTKCVALATALARHSANGWNDAALPDDFAGIADFLKKSPDDTWDRIRHTVLLAAKGWEWYGVPPAAAWLPMQAATLQEKSI